MFNPRQTLPRSTRFVRPVTPCDHLEKRPDHHAELPAQYLSARGVRNGSLLDVELLLDRGQLLLMEHHHLLGSVPAVVLGAVGADMVSDRILKGIFGIGLLVLAMFLILVRSPDRSEPGDRAMPMIDTRSEGKGTTVIRARDGSVYEYPTCWRLPGVLMAAVGGVLTGMISAGLPEISTTQLVVRCRVPPRVAVATSVFTLAIVAAVGAGIHALSAQPVWQVVGWSIPGVLIGSTIGSRVGKYLPARLMEKGLGVVFGGVAILVLVLEFMV